MRRCRDSSAFQWDHRRLNLPVHSIPHRFYPGRHGLRSSLAHRNRLDRQPCFAQRCAGCHSTRPVTATAGGGASMADSRSGAQHESFSAQMPSRVSMLPVTEGSLLMSWRGVITPRAASNDDRSALQLPVHRITSSAGVRLRLFRGGKVPPGRAGDGSECSGARCA